MKHAKNSKKILDSRKTTRILSNIVVLLAASLILCLMYTDTDLSAYLITHNTFWVIAPVILGEIMYLSLCVIWYAGMVMKRTFSHHEYRHGAKQTKQAKAKLAMPKKEAVYGR